MRGTERILRLSGSRLDGGRGSRLDGGHGSRLDCGHGSADKRRRGGRSYATLRGMLGVTLMVSLGGPVA